MDKKNYNLEIFFESQKKSFVILSKNKITFDEVKQRTMREFRIPKEYEKDMRFTIKINNRQITLLNDVQILKNFEEISKNNFYLKIIFNINNNNYVYHSSKATYSKYNPKMRTHMVSNFSIISNVKNNNDNNNNNAEEINKLEEQYKDEIKQLKEEIEKLKSEKTNKGEIDIRKFDEKYRDLNNKNNILEQKITELENENKTLKIGANRNTSTDNLMFENTFENDSMVKEIEKLFSKLISDHEDNIIRELTGLKNTVDNIQKEQKNFYDKFRDIDDNFELLKEEKKLKLTKNIEDVSISLNKEEDNKINNFDEKITNEVEVENNPKIKNDNKIKKIIKDKVVGINKDNNLENSENFDDLDNLADIIVNDKEENKNNDTEKINNNIEQINTDIEKINTDIDKKSNNKINEELIKEQDSNVSKKIKRNINFYDEDEKNSKSFNSSKGKMKIYKKPEKEQKNIIKEIKNSFLENNNNEKNNENNKKIFSKKPSNNKDKEKEKEKNYSKYAAPPRKRIVEKMKIKNQKHDYNLTGLNKEVSYDDLINYESSSEVNDAKKFQYRNRVNTSNSHKSIFVKIDDKKKSTNTINKFLYNDKSLTPTGMYVSDRDNRDSTEKNSYINKKEMNITPTGKTNSIKENIENYFINIFQNIFFYGNNGYMNMLKISDKLLKKLKEGVIKYRLNILDIKDYCIKYISYTIIPIVNDSSTKEYQRKIIKNKISTVLDAVHIDKNYFVKEYKECHEDKKERNSDDRNLGINVTHLKINEFRKMYDLKEKDYPDEQVIKALIRYRGNRELAFQYLFY